MRDFAFTIAIGCASRALMTRDRLLRLPRQAANDSTSLVPLRIRSGQSNLDAIFARPSAEMPKAGVLICHGIGETVRHWEAAQRLLATEGVASLVFNYSGYARSTGRMTAEQFEHDAISAFQRLEELLPSVPISLLGFSLGSGIATAIVTNVNARRLILCAAFTSFREAAGCILPRSLAHLLPDLWNTQAILRTCTVPVLIVNGKADRLFPEQMGHRLSGACAATHELILVPELAHNDPIYRPKLSYWSLIATRMKDCL
jgi:alpha-beta hydrolase superfamily lysophospholipase